MKAASTKFLESMGVVTHPSAQGISVADFSKIAKYFGINLKADKINDQSVAKTIAAVKQKTNDMEGAKLEPYKHEEERLKMREGGSIPVKHHGGLIRKSGPVFAQKGEVIYPKHFQDGGPVSNDLRDQLASNDTGNNLNATVVNVEVDTQGIKSSIEDAFTTVSSKLAEIELKVQEKELVVKLDEENITVSLDTDTVTISNIDDITSAVERANITVSADAVGADNATVEHLEQRINSLGAAVDENTQQLAIVTSAEAVDVPATVQAALASEMSRVNQQLNDNNAKISDLTSTVSRQAYIARTTIENVDRRIQDLKTLSRI